VGEGPLPSTSVWRINLRLCLWPARSFLSRRELETEPTAFESRAGNEAHRELQALKQRGDSLLWLEGSGAKEQCPSLQALDAELDAFGRCVRSSSVHCCPWPRAFQMG
jgi:hypothetical protein